jgi:hypothetical protein
VKARAIAAPSPPGAPKTERKLGLPAPGAARPAAYALTAFSLFTVVALSAWFAREDQPWGFASFVAVVTAILGVGATALFWRQPTRELAMGALGVMGFSLVRVGLPTTWTASSVALITLTALLAIPVVQAAIALPRS